MTLDFHEAAEAEAVEALAYYRDIASELADQFVAALRQSLALIEAHPNAWHPLGNGVCRCRLRRFPYGVVYVQRDDRIVIIAVAHTSRRPVYRRKRLARN